MNNIDDILQRLQEVEQPVIDNPDELTERIMKGLTAVPSPVREGRIVSFLPIIRTILSFAALWIIGFFIYLQFDASQPIVKNEPLSIGEGREGASTLREVYKDYLCQDCKKTISYTQIRTKLYENK